MRILPLIFLMMPLIEIVGLIAFASRFGFGRTMLEVLVTGMAGVMILQRAGMPAIQGANDQLRTGAEPATEVLGGLLRSMGGFLLALPGIVTDLVGLMLVIPVTRNRMIQGMMRNADVFQFDLHTQFRGGGFGPPPQNGQNPGPDPRQQPPRPTQHRPDIIEGEFHRDD